MFMIRRGKILIKSTNGNFLEWDIADVLFLGDKISISWTDGSGRHLNEEHSRSSLVEFQPIA